MTRNELREQLRPTKIDWRQLVDLKNRTVSPLIFFDSSIYEIEQERIFGCSWLLRRMRVADSRARRFFLPGGSMAAGRERMAGRETEDYFRPQYY